MKNQKSNNKLNPDLIAQLLSLVVVGGLLGLADGLNNFFLYKMSGAVPDNWVGDLLFSVFTSSVLGICVVAVAAILLFGLGRGFKLVTRGKVQTIASKVSERLNTAWAAGGVYLLVGFFFSNRSITEFGWALLAAVCLLLIATILPQNKWSMRALKIMPVSAALLSTWAIWYVTCVYTERHFSNLLTYGVWLKAAVPVLLIAVSLTIGMGKSKVLKSLLIVGTLVLMIGWLFSFKLAQLPDASQKPSVLFLVVDTLRNDRVDQRKDLMPSVNKLVAEGIYYKQAYTAFPKTQQSVSSFMTGLYPWNNGVQSFGSILSEEHETIAEVFSKAGYRTASFIHNPWIDFGRGHEQGFQEYSGYLKVESLLPSLHDITVIRALDGIFKSRVFGVGRGYDIDGSVITDAALEWLENKDDRPFFLWVHYFDPHWPYTPTKDAPGLDPRDLKLAAVINRKVKGAPSERNMRFKMKDTNITEAQIDAAIRLYDAESAYNDMQIGRLLQKIDSLDTPPIVVFLADHGESLGEHEYHFHHGDFAYNACLHVPLVFSWPGHIDAGKQVTSSVKLVDIAPTLTSLAGLTMNKTDGEMLPGLNDKAIDAPTAPVPFMSEGRPSSRFARFFKKHRQKAWRGVILEGKKLIEIPKGPKVEYELYDMNEDPNEIHNLYDQETTDISPYLEAMKSLGLPTIDELAAQKAKKPKHRMSDAEKEQLRALGYMQ